MGKVEGRRETRSTEVERLLLSSSKSTVNNTGNYQGRQKNLGDEAPENARGIERGRKGGGEAERKKGGG